MEYAGLDLVEARVSRLIKPRRCADMRQTKGPAMKAVRMHAHGGPGVLVLEDVPDPVPAAGEVLVAIKAASVNAADWKVRSGKSPVTLVFPHILGRDFSGVVETAGHGADIAPGTEVYAVCPPGMEGGYAEKISIGAQYVARKPKNLSHVEAAAIGLAARRTIRWAQLAQASHQNETDPVTQTVP